MESAEKIMNQQLKGISTIIGCILSNIIIGNSLIWLYLPEKADYYFDNKLKTKKVIVSLILTFSNMTKLFFSFYTKYNNIRIYIFISFLLLILSHSLLYMFYIKSISYISFILYGIGVGFPFHQLVTNSSLHFINKKPLILLINTISFNISPVLYYIYFSNTKVISPDGSEIIIFYLIISIITTLLSFDYLRECRSEKNEPNEHSLLIKNELEYSITDITSNTERMSDTSESSTNLNKREKKLFPGENDNVSGVFKSKRQSIILVLKDKNIYLIILYFSCAMFLTVEKVHKIKNDDIHLFFMSVFVSNMIINYILSKSELPPIILRLTPFLIHSLIIIFHTFKKGEYSTQIEIIIVSISYSLQYCVIHPLLKKIYGEKNAIFFTDFVINFASFSRWIVVVFDFIRNSVRILTLVLMIILLLFINTKTFDFNSDRSKNLGIELKERNKEEENENNKEEENEIEDPMAIVDVKSDVE